MPLTHERVFRVRSYECDGNGTVRSANYLRYMQEAAFDASAAAGYDTERYDRMGCLWLIHETDIEYLHPLWYGDKVRVKTWVADFRRIRSLRAYEFYRVGGDELVARAHTDWVFLNVITERPSPIPAEMMAAFFPEGLPTEASRRERFPSSSSPLSGAFEISRRVEWRDIDSMQHVNNATYLEYMEDARRQTLAGRGWPLARLRSEGFGFTVKRYRIEYREPAVLDDELIVATWLSDFERNTMTQHYTIRRVNGETLLIQAQARYECADQATGKTRALPPEFLEDLSLARSQ